MPKANIYLIPSWNMYRKSNKCSVIDEIDLKNLEEKHE